MSTRQTDPLKLRDAVDAYYATKPNLDKLEKLTNPHLPAGAEPSTTENKHPHALTFSVAATCNTTSARAATMNLPHGSVETPVFMPVGTQAAIKGATSEQVSSLNCEIMLGNTYHLGLRPGPDTVADLGGLHRFMNWPNNLLTDSGGFQMVSLVELAVITETGVEFKSPVDGKPMLLTPELSIRIQNLLGADVIMALDDVTSSVNSTPERFIEASHRTIRWIDRCIKAHTRPDQQALFGIVQGGLDEKLRDECLDSMLKRDPWLPGYAIGGLAGGESKDAFWKVIKHCCDRLPKNKPRYAMGVGYPLDLVVCVALGVDAFDCVWPCRTARFGSAIVDSGLLNLRRAEFENDSRPIDENCSCEACTRYSRSMISSLVSTPMGCHLVTLHNLAYMKSLMSRARKALIEGKYPEFVKQFLQNLHPESSKAVPEWTREALTTVNIDFGTWGDANWVAPVKKTDVKKTPADQSTDTPSSTPSKSGKRKLEHV